MFSVYIDKSSLVQIKLQELVYEKILLIRLNHVGSLFTHASKNAKYRYFRLFDSLAALVFIVKNQINYAYYCSCPSEALTTVY